MSRIGNALREQTSPYLLQHAHNPVAWHPWCEEALGKARREDKPILLSVGYSACHWCHVMAHESFEDEETARLMNAMYVNIKVDREERPDLDKIYQLAHQILMRRPGGWPLTMFLTPHDRTPFFGGTYFPLQSRFGMPAFREILTRVAVFYGSHRKEIQGQNESLLRALRSLEPRAGAPAPVTSAPLLAARSALGRLFDREHGGFGAAPKFPHPTNIERLMRDYARSIAAGAPDEEALHMARSSLRRMALGGLYDQLGGGFCRYSVDDYWMIPHFEKMLYDNAPLLALCCDLWQVTGEPLFRRVAVETAGWVMREMQAPRGGYYSTLDADSEGEEGKYYVWTPDEVASLLDAEEFAVIEARFGLDRPPNFEGKCWHLHVFRDGEALARASGLEGAQLSALLDTARAKLLAARSRRVRPGLDDKVLTSWNGLMIGAMAKAGMVLGEAGCLESAERAVAFVREKLWCEGRLLATCKDERAHLNAYLDDYAFMLHGILALLEARWCSEDLDFAVALAEVLLEHYADAEEGGFFFTAGDHESLIVRHKPIMDDAVPAGNGVAAQALIRLGHLLGEPRYLAAAEGVIRLAWGSLSEAPHAHNSVLLALEDLLCAPQTIILRGAGETLRAWHARCKLHYAPRRQVFAVPVDDTALPGALAVKVPREETVAYICEGAQCGPPITDYTELDVTLAPSEVRTRS